MNNPVVKAAGHLSLFFAAVFVWLLTGMVMANKFIPPFAPVERLLMPWKALYDTPEDFTLQSRMDFMHGLLQQSRFVSAAAFMLMSMSFVLISAYAVYVYQNKRREERERRMLILKNLEIARRNEFIRYISATIGHEFKNNLGRIKRRIDLAGLAPDARERIDLNFNKLFADIEIFKKISDERESGLMEFDRVDLNELLNEITRDYADLADIRFGGDIAPPRIFASRTLLKTVFENLFDNAVKYKKPDQARAAITIESTVDMDGMRQYATLIVRDEGMGMDEEQADVCFYKRSASGAAGDSGGWGEGLYFAKYVIGLHAGKIRVGKEYTAAGRGAEFIVNLPFVEEAI